MLIVIFSPSTPPVPLLLAAAVSAAVSGAVSGVFTFTNGDGDGEKESASKFDSLRPSRTESEG